MVVNIVRTLRKVGFSVVMLYTVVDGGHAGRHLVQGMGESAWKPLFP